MYRLLFAFVLGFVSVRPAQAYPGAPNADVRSDVKSVEAALARGFDAVMLKGLISIPSVSSSVAENNRAVRYLKEWFDARSYAHLNLPTVIFGATGFGTHAKQERVSLQSLVEYTEMFTKYLRELEY